MPKIVHCRIKFKSLDAIVDDPTISVTFSAPGASDFSSIAAVTGACRDLVNAAGTGGAEPLAFYLHPVLSRVALATETEVYDVTAHLDGTAAGSPVAIDSFTLGASAGGVGLPEGVAATVGFRADYGLDPEFGPHTRPRARDRNRFYVGPLTSNTCTSIGAGNRTGFTNQFITDCLAALFNLSETHSSGGTDWNLVVWSRVNAAVKMSTVGFMDDRPDYQRRRTDPSPLSLHQRALASV